MCVCVCSGGISVTCNYRISPGQPVEDVCEEADISAGLQVAHALAQDGGEHAPYLGLGQDTKGLVVRLG